MAAILHDIYRYPVKGMNGQRLETADIAPGATIPGDRMFALGRPGLEFDTDNPTWRPKTNFLALVRDARLAELDTSYDDATASLTIRHDGEERLCANLDSPEGRAATERFFGAFMADDISGPPTLLRAEGHSFSDLDAKVLSLINLETVRALEAHTRAPLNPLRFRANLYVEGLEPRDEEGWEGRRITIGAVPFEVLLRTQRCAATNVNPDTATRDINIPAALQKNWGHADLGVYLRALGGGAIRAGDQIMLGTS
ncbi:MAG: MOSC domain-containing protein [Alphaproteobacteria bacterium]|nr:MOSC domain-containing protein [Alphaproteobacteria bacterium]